MMRYIFLCLGFTGMTTLMAADVDQQYTLSLGELTHITSLSAKDRAKLVKEVKENPYSPGYFIIDYMDKAKKKRDYYNAFLIACLAIRKGYDDQDHLYNLMDLWRDAGRSEDLFDYLQDPKHDSEIAKVLTKKVETLLVLRDAEDRGELKAEEEGVTSDEDSDSDEEEEDEKASGGGAEVRGRTPSHNTDDTTLRAPSLGHETDESDT